MQPPIQNPGELAAMPNLPHISSLDNNMNTIPSFNPNDSIFYFGPDGEKVGELSDQYLEQK